ncbi:uncharacterized protein [Amphiura filiformis]|uniref:uncharacterized protein isoform X2 n=1 Tax=Amphiura filiformis TaxID=82378 RepID=UPI003B21DEC8
MTLFESSKKDMVFIAVRFIVILLNILICQAADNDFVIVTDIDNATIFTGPTDTLQFQRIPLQNVKRPVAIDYDPVEQRIYWTDETDININRAFINGTGQEVVVELQAPSVPYGITIDIDNRHIYWTDEGSNRIERANLDGSSRQIILQDNLDKPRSIIVDSAGRHIYWTEWGRDRKIERSSLNGTEKVTLVGSDLANPNGVDVDFKDQRIYWCDAGTNKIESADLNGENRHQHFYISNPDIIPFDIGVYKENIYWTDWRISRLLTVKKHVVQIAEHVGSLIFQKAGGLHIHQEHDGSCSSDPCEHGGRCRQLPSGYQCVCVPGYSGNTCESDIYECTSSPCMNDGQCVDGINSYVCQCSVYWRGENCELDVNECTQTPSPCHADADCFNSKGSYICQCQPGFTGDGNTNCIEIDNCDPDPCQNDGVCINRINDFDCSCINGFTGTICDVAPSDPCRYQPCRNGATCRSVGDQIMCQCVDGYSGELCDTDIDECSSNPCQNDGICNDLVNRFLCDCTDYYEGALCELQAAIGCPHPGELANGYVISGGTSNAIYPHGQRIEYVCEDDYELQGTKVIFCQTDSTWSHEMPTCVKEKDGPNTNALIGGGSSIGLIILILIVVLLVVCVTKMRKSGTNNLLERPRLDPPVPKEERPFTPSHSSHYAGPYDHRQDPLYDTRISYHERRTSPTYAEIPELYEIPISNRLPPNPPAYDTLRKNDEMESSYSTHIDENCTSNVDANSAGNENGDSINSESMNGTLANANSESIKNENSVSNENTNSAGTENANSAGTENKNIASVENVNSGSQENLSHVDADDESDYVAMKEGVKIDIRMPNRPN